MSRHERFLVKLRKDRERKRQRAQALVPCSGDGACCCHRCKPKLVVPRSERKKVKPPPKPPPRPKGRTKVKCADKRTRESVFAADDFRCRYCGSTEDLTVDHIIPRTFGGTNKRENLQTLCRSCNLEKGCNLSASVPR